MILCKRHKWFVKGTVMLYPTNPNGTISKIKQPFEFLVCNCGAESSRWKKVKKAP